VERNITNKAY